MLLSAYLSKNGTAFCTEFYKRPFYLVREAVFDRPSSRICAILRIKPNTELRKIRGTARVSETLLPFTIASESGVNRRLNNRYRECKLLVE
ncbi:hypothetical protein GWI33_008500 [Rhynchophorus ferrugineus]|uniref:Uncharacterized protein n=1 Tax=Rhynchophorus ferrugineus TaxID=354439 RepID=A0A834MC68_RHYFE|nr:hypothetical protein GWI33_008500 [Rhynchophorus ferrugineus]